MATKIKPVPKWRREAELLAKAHANYDKQMQEKEALWLRDFGYKHSFAAGFAAGIKAARKLSQP